MNFEFGYKSVDLFDCTIVEGSRNFSGEERKRNGRVMNSEGNRNFLIELDPDAYETFKDAGWNVGRFAQREEGIEPNGFLRVTVSYFKQPPIIHLISGDTVTDLDESRLHRLDRMNILDLDIRCNVVNKQNRDGDWKKNAYVDEMWVTVTPDRFAAKYAHLQPSQDSLEPDDVSES